MVLSVTGNGFFFLKVSIPRTLWHSDLIRTGYFPGLLHCRHLEPSLHSFLYCHTLFIKAKLFLGSHFFLFLGCFFPPAPNSMEYSQICLEKIFYFICLKMLLLCPHWIDNLAESITQVPNHFSSEHWMYHPTVFWHKCVWWLRRVCFCFLGILSFPLFLWSSKYLTIKIFEYF